MTNVSSSDDFQTSKQVSYSFCFTYDVLHQSTLFICCCSSHYVIFKKVILAHQSKSEPTPVSAADQSATFAEKGAGPGLALHPV